MKSILLLSSSMTFSDWVCAEKILKDSQTQGYILAYDRYICSQMHRIANKVLLIDDYFPQTEWQNINKLATEWGTKWYLQPGLEKKMVWSDIQLASIVLYPLHYTFNAILRLCVMITRLIDEQKPDRLEFFLRNWEPTSISPNDQDPLLEIVAKHIASQRGLKIVNHADITFITNAFILARANAKNKIRLFLRELRKLSRRFRRLKYRIPPPNKTHSKRILFAQSSHSILEIAQILKDDDVAYSLWVTLGRRPCSIRAGHIDLEAYIPLKFSSVYRRATRLLSRQYMAICSEIAAKQFFIFYDIDLLPIIQVWIKYLIYNEFPRLVLNIEAADKIIREYKPNMVFADNSLLEVERIFFLLACKYNILKIESLHGMLNNFFFLMFPIYQNIADRLLLLGEFGKDKKIALGGTPERYLLAGYARFDSYFACIANANVTGLQNKQPLRIGITCEKLYKFYGLAGILNSLEAVHVKYYKYILKAAQKMPNVIFSFKTRSNYGKHPLLKELINEFGIKNFEILETVKIEEWFSSLSALITDFSTMGLEAMIFDVPVVILNLSGWADPVGFESSDAVDVATSDDELYQALLANMANPKNRAQKRMKFVRYALADTEGTAAKRTAQILFDLLHEHTTPKNKRSKHV